MTPNTPDRSQRTTSTQPIKRGANTAYFMSRLARDHPRILAQLQAGAFPSVRAAAKAAGLINDVTPLEQLERWWQRASADDRDAFLDWIHCATPRPKRLRRLTQAVWHERLVEVRQHLQQLGTQGLVERRAETWQPEVQQGYMRELRLLINELTMLRHRIESVRGDEVRREQEEDGLADRDIDPYDPSRADKWWYSPEDAEVVFPTLTHDPPPPPEDPS
jgi:hypothetical protein